MSSIQKPYNLNFNGITIDAKLVNTLTWQVSGNLQTSFSITVLNNSTGATVWTLPKTTSYATSYSIPANSFSNGLTLKLYIQVWDVSGNTTTSDSIIFSTSTTPVITFSTIPSPITAPSYNFGFTYYQAESVLMKSWIAYLYDSKGNELIDSGIQTTSATPLSYTLTGFQTNTNYQVEVQSTSNTGLIGTTGKQSFLVQFSAPQLNSTLTATNNMNDGSITLSIETIQIIGVCNVTPIFVTNDFIDLTQQGSNVTFNTGFSVLGDLTLKLWIKNPANKKDLMILSGDNGTYRLQYYWLDNCFHLFKTISGSTYADEWISGSVVSGNYFLGIQQIGNLCNLVALENTI